MSIFTWFARFKPQFRYLRIRLRIVHDEINACKSLIEHLVVHTEKAVQAAVTGSVHDKAVADELHGALTQAIEDGKGLMKTLGELTAPNPLP